MTKKELDAFKKIVSKENERVLAEYRKKWGVFYKNTGSKYSLKKLKETSNEDLLYEIYEHWSGDDCQQSKTIDWDDLWNGKVGNADDNDVEISIEAPLHWVPGMLFLE